MSLGDEGQAIIYKFKEEQFRRIKQNTFPRAFVDGQNSTAVLYLLGVSTGWLPVQSARMFEPLASALIRIIF
jgi:hypothetical protein